MKTELWGVFTQFYPTYDYEPHLESIWDSKEKALAEAKTYKSHDFVWIQKLVVNDPVCYLDSETVEVRKL